jgi:hypothetical protein
MTLKVADTTIQTIRLEAVLRVERRGVGPDGSLRYAWEATRGSLRDSTAKPVPLATFPGLKMTDAIDRLGGWAESRWEIPPGTPKDALEAAELVQPRLSLPLPPMAVGRGATWDSEQQAATTTDLKTAIHGKSRFTIVDFDDQEAHLSVQETTDQPAHSVQVNGETIALDQGACASREDYVIRFDRLVSSGSSSSTTRWRARRPDGSETTALTINEERITTIAPPAK